MLSQQSINYRKEKTIIKLLKINTLITNSLSMKFYLNILISGLVLFFPIRNYAQNKTIFSGIANYATDSIELTSPNLIKYIFAVDSLGCFHESVSQSSPGYFELKIRGELHTIIFLMPGDSIYLQCSKNNGVPKLYFSGSNDAYNNYLYSYEDIYQKYRPIFRTKLFNAYTKKEKKFMKIVAEYKNDLQENLKKESVMLNMTSECIRQENIRIDCHCLSKIAFYPDYYERYTGQKSETDDSFYSFLDTINFNDSTLLIYPEYKSLSTRYIKRLAKQKALSLDYEHIDNKDLLIQFACIDSAIHNRDAINFLYFQLLNSYIKTHGLFKIENALQIFFKNCTDSVYVDLIEKQTGKKQFEKLGRQANDFTYSDPDSNLVTLSSFRGKYVYIDVWATWCGPCRRELPYLEELQKKYSEKKLVFISVSVDKDRKQWQKMAKNMSGIQLHAGGWQGITEEYDIQAIPRFILIDKNGLVLNPNAPRPSDGIEDVFENLNDL